MLDNLKNRARKLPFFPHVRGIFRRFRSGGVRHPLQNTKADRSYPLNRLGTEYGGWTFVDDSRLYGSTIISAGLGEDASFDVEIAKRYGATIVVVDPTPRAITHFEEICANFGNDKSTNYVPGGKQPVSAYDLRQLDSAHFKLIPKALWNTASVLKFFSPDNPRHVSHSVVNFHHDYAQDTRHIEVDSITLDELLSQLPIDADELQLIKLDIEGAEIEVISDFLQKGIRPRQILVEFDELNAKSPIGLERVDFIHEMLTSCAYKCIWTDGKADFLYVLVPSQLES